MLTSYRIWKTLAFFFWARADYLSFRPQRSCDCKTIQSHLKAQNFPMFGKFSAFNHRVFILLLPHLPSMELLKLVKESGSYSPHLSFESLMKWQRLWAPAKVASNSPWGISVRLLFFERDGSWMNLTILLMSEISFFHVLAFLCSSRQISTSA